MINQIIIEGTVSDVDKGQFILVNKYARIYVRADVPVTVGSTVRVIGRLNVNDCYTDIIGEYVDIKVNNPLEENNVQD